MQILTGKYIELANAFVHNIFQRNVCVVLCRRVEHIAVTEVTVIIETIEIECMSKDFFFAMKVIKTALPQPGLFPPKNVIILIIIKTFPIRNWALIFMDSFI